MTAPTSLEAWDKVSENLSERQLLVLSSISINGVWGATINETAASLMTTPNTISGRFSELAKMALIVKATTDKGQYLRRKSAAGVSCQVWVIDKGQLKLF